MDERDVLATQFDAYRTRLQAVAYRMLGSTSEAAHSHLLRLAAGSWALLMLLFERDVCTIEARTKAIVSTNDGGHQLDSRNGQQVLHYPNHDIRRRSPVPKRGVASCEI